jgi:hypothetical protein
MRRLARRLPALSAVWVGLSFCEAPASADESTDDWGLHAQSTFVAQYHPGFASASRFGRFRATAQNVPASSCHRFGIRDIRA